MVSIAASYMKDHDDDLIQKFPKWEFFKDDTKANMAYRVAGAWHREKRKNAAKSGVYKSTSLERVDSHSTSSHPPIKIRLHKSTPSERVDRSLVHSGSPNKPQLGRTSVADPLDSHSSAAVVITKDSFRKTAPKKIATKPASPTELVVPFRQHLPSSAPYHDGSAIWTYSSRDGRSRDSFHHSDTPSDPGTLHTILEAAAKSHQELGPPPGIQMA